MSKITPNDCHMLGSLVRVDFNILVKGWRLECEHLIHQGGSWLLTGQKIGAKKFLKERARKDRQAEQETRTTQQEIKPETTKRLRL